MELDDEDRPPESIWLDNQAINEHFDSVRARREDKARGVEVVDDAPMLQNELTKNLRR